MPENNAPTAKQGQYLAYIRLCEQIHRKPPAEADIQDFFRVSPPTVHSMILTLERRGLIARTPRAPRSIKILLGEEKIPTLQSIKTSGMAN